MDWLCGGEHVGSNFCRFVVKREGIRSVEERKLKRVWQLGKSLFCTQMSVKGRLSDTGSIPNLE